MGAVIYPPPGVPRGSARTVRIPRNSADSARNSMNSARNGMDSARNGMDSARNGMDSTEFRGFRAEWHGFRVIPRRITQIPCGSALFCAESVLFHIILHGLHMAQFVTCLHRTLTSTNH